MDWTDIKLTTIKADADKAEAIATGISGSGIYIEDYSDLEEQVLEMAHVDLIEQELIDKDRNIVIIHLYLSAEQNVNEIIELLNMRIEDAEITATIEVTQTPEEDWENGWKAYYHAMNIGKRLTICPSWEEIKTDRQIIKIDPGMAFGTGTHETTSLCLTALDEIITGGERLLDIGTGSGILGIAAVLLGADSALGVDIDEMCVRVAGENAEINQVGDKFKAVAGNLSDKASGQYDVITANIVANAIIMLSPEVKPLLKDGGIFIASGIIDERAEEVKTAIEAAGLRIKETRTAKGWVCILAV